MSDAGLKIMDRQLSVIKSNWGVEDIWSFFPENIRPKNGYIGSSAISLLRQISDTVSLERGRNLIIEECESTGTTVRVGFAGLSRIWNRLKVNPEAIDTKSADDGSTATSTNADSPLPGSFQTPNNGTTSEKRNGKKNLVSTKAPLILIYLKIFSVILIGLLCIRPKKERPRLRQVINPRIMDQQNHLRRK